MNHRKTAVLRPLLLLVATLLPVWGQAAAVQQNWDEHCASCHGATGDGKTKTGTKLHIKDYTSPKVQAEFSDTGLLKNILLGIDGENDAHRMPAFKDKLTPAEAKELVTLIRSFKK